MKRTKDGKKYIVVDNGSILLNKRNAIMLNTREIKPLKELEEMVTSIPGETQDKVQIKKTKVKANYEEDKIESDKFTDQVSSIEDS